MDSTLSQSAPVADAPVHSGHAVRRLPIAIATVWLFLVLTGLSLLWHYANTPGTAAQIEKSWPGSAIVQLDRNEKTLIMFAHPHCPCTRASIGELERLLAQCSGGVAPWVVFFAPSDVADGWEHSDLWNRAAAIPGVHVVADIDGKEAKRFGAATSGQTYVFDGDGDLLFRGGITASRGHEGDNPGRDAVVQLLCNGVLPRTETPVFGCPIYRD